ncbi:MAG: hypothetical protein L6R39_002747 [Caloplaca ligustica]|nr:MAG: hypothetical protein L6R39_002747 [Caloplaca ligustica]
MFRSYGVQNIERRFSAGGGSPSHTPGAATKLGDMSNVTSGQEKSTGRGTPYHQEKFGEQRPEGGQFDKSFNKAQLGDDQGK